MFRNYLTIAFRSLVKDKLSTVINAVGLSVGLATCFLIYTWVRFETSYDQFLPESDRVYRVVTQFSQSTEQGIASTYPMVKSRVLSQFPEVEESARIFNQGLLGSKTRISYHERVFVDDRFFFADSSFFKVFPFALVSGEAGTVLRKTNAVVLSRTMAAKLFGHEDPIGKIILVGAKLELEVSGVMEDMPSNSHFHIDLLASMQAHPWIRRAEEMLWSGVVFHTYVKLKSGASRGELEKKMATVLNNFPNDPDHFGKQLDLRLQALADIHLESALKWELEPNGNIQSVYLFITIAILVLVVAVINYTNLVTARQSQRFKEVGVRKVLGASRTQLIRQFMTESMVISFMSLVLAILLIELAGPVLAVQTGVNYWLNSIFDPQILLALGMITVVIGLLTGFSPALALSRFRPARLFRSRMNTSFQGITIRQVLIVSQFTVSIALTICTAITYQQVTYLRDAKLGYNLDHTVVLNIGFRGVQEKYALLKSQLTGNTSILGATATSQLPTDIQTGENVDVSKLPGIGVNCISVDHDFFKVMGIELRQGENVISNLQESDSINHFVVNESALKELGLKDGEAVNRMMTIRHGNMRPGAIVGVVSDFHFQSLHHAMGPLVLEFDPSGYQYLLIRVHGENLQATLDFISRKWETVSGGIPFDYMFLDQEYNRLYKSEQRSGTLFIIFSIVAVFISLLGLFGLTTFAVEKRTKEIGLRKVLGANVSSIMTLMSRDFLLLLIISFALAVPIGWYYMNTWLAHFAFKTAIGPGLFLLAGGINLILAIVILSYHGLKIASANPVDTLRCE